MNVRVTLQMGLFGRFGHFAEHAFEERAVNNAS
jgi:hypothetical protein